MFTYLAAQLALAGTVSFTTPFYGTDVAMRVDDSARVEAQLADDIRTAADTLDLDDYGTLLLAARTIEALPVSEGRRHVDSASEALQRGRWSRASQEDALAAVIQELGIGATTLSRGGVAVRVRPDDLASYGTLERCRGYDCQTASYVIWDGDSFGLGGSGDWRADRLFAGRPADIASIDIPDFVLRRSVAEEIVVPDTGTTLTVQRRPVAARYMSAAPDLEDAAHAARARMEFGHLGLEEDLRRLRRDAGGEEAAYTALLRAFQGHFRYERGPLESVFRTFEVQDGDCDQLSMILQAALVEMGAEVEDIVLMDFPDHLALGVRPRQSDPGGASFRWHGHRYVALDSTMYVRGRRGEFITEWGDLGDHGGFRVTPLDAPRERAERVRRGPRTPRRTGSPIAWW